MVTLQNSQNSLLVLFPSRVVLLTFYLVCSLSLALAQQPRFGHEWINHQQTYLKISIGQTARYRITYADLQRAAVPIATVKPAAFQLFRRGIEQSVYVEGQADGRFDATDYIEFYGQANDGTLDSVLYQEASSRQPHTHYSLFSDTAVYFLTWRLDGQLGKRIDTASTSVTGLYHDERDLRLFTTDYPGYPAGIAGQAESSLYTDGEGYTGSAQPPGRFFDQLFSLTTGYYSGLRPQLEVLVVGRTSGTHRVQLWIGPSSEKRRLADSVVFDGFINRRMQVELSWDDVGPDGQLLVSTIAQGASGERYSVSYMQVQYPKRGRAIIQTLPVPIMQPVSFLSLDNRSPSYLIVTHESLMKSAGNTPDAVRAYAAYRASVAGGGFDTCVVRVQQLFDLFTYGERSPLAIRRFVQYMLHRGQPRSLLLLGRARSVPGVRTNPQQALLDLVPTYGFPGSDVLFSAGLNGFSNTVPALATGRINAATPQDVVNYLSKVIEYEAEPAGAIWRKKLLHLSGGRSSDELFLFRNIVQEYRQLAEGMALGASVETIAKQTDDPVETLTIQEPVNDGVGLITFFGHSSLSISDLDIGLVSNDVLGYRNTGKYPFLFVNGCAMGNFFFGAPTLTADWILTPNRGAIAALAHSHLGYIASLRAYGTAFYQVITDSTQLGNSIGEWQQAAIRRALAQSAGPFERANAQQMVLQGDPAIRLFPFSQPDYRLSAPQHWIGPTSHSDSIQLGIVITNGGLFRRSPLTVRIRRWVQGKEVAVVHKVLAEATAYRDTLWVMLPTSATGVGKQVFVVTVNPDHIIAESDFTNNQVVLSADLQKLDSEITVVPDRVPPLIEVAFDNQFIRDQEVVSARPTLTIQIIDDNRLLLRQDTTGLNLYLQRPASNQLFERLSWQQPGVRFLSAQADNVFQITYPMPRLAAGAYQLQLQAEDVSGNKAAPYRINFNVIENRQLTEVKAYPNPFSHYLTFSFTLTGDLAPNEAELRITDLNGCLVRRLTQSARVGLNRWVWDGRSENGAWLAAGAYIYQLSLRSNGANWPATETAQKQQQGRILFIR